jgi:hypothetical protein
MKKSDSSWSPLYLAIGVFGVFVGRMLAIEGPTAVPTVFILFAGSGTLLFTASTVFAGLWKRFGDSQDHSVLDTSIWDSSPANAQSNHLAQVIFFGSIGISSLIQSRSSVSESVGFLPLTMAVGIGGGLFAFRWRYRGRLSRAPR